MNFVVSSTIITVISFLIFLFVLFGLAWLIKSVVNSNRRIARIEDKLDKMMNESMKEQN